MKGFIEVTPLSSEKILINISKIREVSENWIFYDNDYIQIEQTYEQIKELIKQAQ